MNEGDPVPAVLETLLAWGAYAFLASLAVLVLCLWLHRRAPDRFGFGRLGLLFFVPAVACVAVGWNAGRSAEGLFVLLTGWRFRRPRAVLLGLPAFRAVRDRPDRASRGLSPPRVPSEESDQWGRENRRLRLPGNEGPRRSSLE